MPGGRARVRAQASEITQWQFESVANGPQLGCVTGMTLAGFEYDPAGRPVLAWREDNNCGGPPRVFWTRQESGSWNTRQFQTERRYGGGGEGDADHQMVLRPSDGNPFLVYMDVGAFNSLNTVITDLGAYPTGGRSGVLEFLVPAQSCAFPEYSLAFAPSGQFPDWATRLSSCDGFGPIRIDGTTVSTVAPLAHPALAVTADGTRHLLWNTGPDVFYTRWPAADPAPTTAAPLFTNVNLNGGEVRLASDAGGTLHAVVRGVKSAETDGGAGALVYMQSTDGGQTWSPFEYIDPADAVPHSYGINADISFALDSHGVPAVTYWRFRQELWYARRDGPGGTWTQTRVTVMPYSGFAYSAQLRFDSADNPVIAYYDRATNQLRLARPVPAGAAPPPIDIALTGAVAPRVSQPGAPLAYTLTVTNRGLTNVDHVVVANALPAAAALVSTSPSADADGRWPIGLLTSGASRTITVSATAPFAAGDAVDIATVTSDGPDTDPANNTVVLGTTVRPDSCFPPKSGLGGLWRGDGSAVDGSSGGRDGVVHGGVGYAPGVNGSTFLFDGTTGYVDVSETASLNDLNPQGGSFSITASVKSSVTADQQIIISKYECGGNCPSGVANSMYELYLAGNAAGAYLRDTNGRGSQLQGSRLVTDGQFHRLALVRDVAAGELRLYVDGTIDASAPLAGGAAGALKDDDGSSDPFTIGAIQFGGSGARGYFFNGAIGDVAYYSRALGDADVLAMATSSSAPECGGTTTSQGLDVSAAVTSAPNPAAVNGVITYVVKATNVGTLDASGVTLVNVLPPGVAFLDSVPTPLSNDSGAQSYRVDLPASNSTWIVIRGRAAAPGTFVDRASVATAGDVTAANDTASTTTVVEPDACFVPSTGLVSRWRGDGNAVDDVGGHNGVVQGTAAFAIGQVGQGFAFDGLASYVVTVPDAPALRPALFTVSAWARPVSFGSGNAVVSTGDSLWLGFVNGYPTVYTHGHGISARAPTQAQANQWTHLAATYDGATVRLYVNGVLAAENGTDGWGAMSYDVRSPFAIGRVSLGGTVNNQLFHGLIDEVTLHDRALTDAEVRGLYDGSSPSCPQNHPPEIVNPGDQTSLEGATVSLPISGNDADGNALTYSAAGLPPGLILDPATHTIGGHIGFQAAGNYPVTIAVGDGTATSTASFTWTVTNVPCSPFAQDDSATTPPGAAIDISVLDNDIVPAACIAFGPPTISGVTQPPHGTVVFDNKLRTVTYTPAAGFEGIDTFAYTIANSDGGTSAASVTVTVRTPAPLDLRLPSCQVPRDGLVALWGGDGSALDDTGHGRDGLVHGGVSYRPGVVGTAFRFDGATGYVSVGGVDNDLFPQDGPFTLSMWVKTVDRAGTAILASKIEPGVNGAAYYIGLVQGIPITWVQPSVNAESASTPPVDMAGSHSIADGKYHHIAIVRENVIDPFPGVSTLGVMHLYVDGQIDELEGANLIGSLQDSNGVTDPLSIGASIGADGSPANFLAGALDDVAFYRRALGPAELQAIVLTRSRAECGPPDDAVPPDLTVPADIAVVATSAAGATVDYSVAAIDALDGPVPVACDPASGTTFSIATTIVTCSATDLDGNASIKSFLVNVQPMVVASQTTLAVTPNPATIGQSLTLTATVVAPGASTLSGTVTFAEGQTVLGTAPLALDGTAAFTTTNLALGGHNLTAAYGGSAQVAPSQSPVVTVTVNPLPPIVISVTEQIGVSDSSALLPSALVAVAETIGVLDTENVLPSVMFAVAESIGVQDAPDVLAVVAGNTAAGSNVVVTPVDPTTGRTPVSLTFSNVISGGDTSVTSGQSGPPLAAGFRFGVPAVYFDITTTAVFSGTVTVCIDYGGMAFARLGAIQLQHFEAGRWVNRTVSVNLRTHQICAVVTSLSPFVVVEAISLAPVLTNPGDQTSDEGQAVSLQLVATDMEPGRLTFSAKGLPPGLHITPAGLISGMPAEHAAGVYAVTVRVSHGVLTATQSFRWTVIDMSGRMTGQGHVAGSWPEHSFAFTVTERRKGTDYGHIDFWIRDADPSRKNVRALNRLDASSITAVTFSDDPGFKPGRQALPTSDTVAFSGSGRWNGRVGYTFEATATDQGEPGAGRDTFAITIRDGLGTIVATVNGTLAEGNIKSGRLRD